MTSRKLYMILAYAGAVPFVACAVMLAIGVEAVAPLGPLDALASSYAIVIVSFLAGIHWATGLYEGRRTQLNLFISSNVVLLFVWFAYVLAPVAWQLSSQVLAMVVLALIDVRLRRQAVISSHYLRMRLVATALAVASLIAVVLVR